MAKYSEPKDYMLGRKAYKAYFDGVAIEFTDLSHEYQMRWVNVARAVVGEVKRLAPQKEAYSTNLTIAPDAIPHRIGGGAGTFKGGGSGVVTILPNETGDKILDGLPRKPSGRIDYDQIPESMHGKIKRASQARSKRLYREKHKT